MKKTVLFAASAALMLAACTESINDLGEVTPGNETPTDAKTVVLSPEELCLIQQIANKTPKISPEAAQETAMQLLGLQNQTSSLSKKMTATVFCNKKQVYNSLTKSYKQENDTVFYVFNTPDEQGFAIVAADLRVPNQVLAYSDNGNFDPETDNPEIAFLLDLAKKYVDECITNAKIQEDSLAESICRKFGIEVDSKKQNSLTKVKELMRIPCTTAGLPTITITSTHIVKPMIKTDWGQCWPFNKKCDEAVAGCAPIAIAQILAYWQKPNVLNGQSFNWSIIESGFPKNTFEDQVSSLVQIIRTECHTKGGSTNTADILPFLRKIGFSQQSIMNDYKYEDVTNALANGRPVFMIGFEFGKSTGHAWIADGYLKRYGTQETPIKYCIVEELDDGTITERFEDIITTSPIRYEFLSINWGWYGDGNGFFLKNAFSTYNRFEQDTYRELTGKTPNDINEHYNYDSGLQTITDIYPRR